MTSHTGTCSKTLTTHSFRSIAQSTPFNGGGMVAHSIFYLNLGSAEKLSGRCSACYICASAHMFCCGCIYVYLCIFEHVCVAGRKPFAAATRPWPPAADSQRAVESCRVFTSGFAGAKRRALLIRLGALLLLCWRRLSGLEDPCSHSGYGRTLPGRYFDSSSDALRVSPFFEFRCH